MSEHPFEKTYDHKRFEFLSTFGRDLTSEAAQGKLNAFVGRDREIQIMIETLCRRTKRNPLLLGGAGVGKTAIVEGLAKRIVQDEVPKMLYNYKIFSVQAAALIAGTVWHGMIETRVKNLLAEARHPGVIIFIDEIHAIGGAGPGDNPSRSIAEQLKPALSRGEIICIGATTDDEYRRFIETDAALERRFQPINIIELSSEQTLEILQTLRQETQIQTGLQISEKIPHVILNYAERFLRNRSFPDKAIDLFEQTIAYAESNKIEKVTSEEAEIIIKKMVGMTGNLDDSLAELSRAVKQKELLSAGQTAELSAFLNVSIQGMNLNPARPNAVILMVGEAAKKADTLAKVIAKSIYAGDDKVVSIDFGAIKEQHELSRLIGPGPGLFNTGGSVPVHEIAQNPWSVIVCEGIDSCHPAVRDILSRSLASGFITDGKGKKIYLSDTIIILTAPSANITAQKMGFSGADKIGENEIGTQTRARLTKILGAELVNSIDFISSFEDGFSDGGRRQWLKENLLHNLTNRFCRQGIDVFWEESIIRELLRRQSSSEDMREWERLINFWLLPPLISHLQKHTQPILLTVTYQDDAIAVQIKEAVVEDKMILKFTSAAQEKVFSDIYIWIADSYRLEKKRGIPIIKISGKGKAAEVFIYDRKGEILITIQTSIAESPEFSDDLLQHLLRKNAVLRFAKFALDANGTILLEHTLFAENCNRNILLKAIRDLLESESKFAAEIKSRGATEIPADLSEEQFAWLDKIRIKK